MVLSGRSNSQELPAKTVPQLSLHILQTVPVTLRDDYGFWSSAQCNQDGTVYWRAAKVGDFHSDPVWKISSKWDGYTEFSLPKDLVEKEFVLRSFTVAPDGTFYGVAHSPLNEQTLLLRFDTKGDISSKTALEPAERVLPRLVAVFPTGETLLYGWPYEATCQACRGGSSVGSSNAAGKEMQEQLAIYAPNGRLLTPIRLPTPEGSRLVTQQDDIAANVRGGKQATERHSKLLPRWAVAMAEDGNAYLLGGTQIFAVSARGEVVRTIPLSDIPSGFVPINIQASHGILSVTLEKGRLNALVEAVRFRAIEAATGTVQADYLPEADLGTSQLCFTANEGYTFYVVKDKKSYVARAWIR